MESTYSTNLATQTGTSKPTRDVKVIPLHHPSSTKDSSTTSEAFAKWKAKVNRMEWNEWIEMFLPCYRWIRTYKLREYLQPDLMAGITVGIMLVPQLLKQIDMSTLTEFILLFCDDVPS
ncbi:transporter [Lithospermum erythrorhizon]|uniref:Transporter n=1 Tax=Lithospermum erythrorhizon TaxID=34254 RepID=A0AAV3PCP3_LITER